MRRQPIALAAVLGLVLLPACGGQEADEEVAPAPAGTPAASASAAVPGAGGPPSATESPEVTVTLQDPDGQEVGTVSMTSVDAGTEVSVAASGLEPGFHGLHVHEVGLCEPGSASPSDPSTTGDFLSAGGHVGVGDSDHGTHPGDLPSLHVTEAGEASLTTVTDAFTPTELVDGDGDGSAVMVHSGADDFANVPERYAPGGPDQDTLDTGDSGSRVACGVVE